MGKSKNWGSERRRESIESYLQRLGHPVHDSILMIGHRNDITECPIENFYGGLFRRSWRDFPKSPHPSRWRTDRFWEAKILHEVIVFFCKKIFFESTASSGWFSLSKYIYWACVIDPRRFRSFKIFFSRFFQRGCWFFPSQNRSVRQRNGWGDFGKSLQLRRKSPS